MRPSTSATGIPTPIPILADVGKLFTNGAALGIGTGVGAVVVVGGLEGVELVAAKDEELAVDAELGDLGELEDETDEEDTDAELIVSTR
jgi:hypothetical protein